MTLVVDASVVAEVLLGTERGRRASALLGNEDLTAPNHLSAEVLSVLRGWCRGGHLSEERALRAIEEFGLMDVEQLDMTGSLTDVFALRHNLSAYDAFYVVLARALECRLLTYDARLARAASDCALIP